MKDEVEMNVFVSVEQLVVDAESLQGEQKKDGLWAYKVCLLSSDIHEDIIECSPPANYVHERVLPVLNDLAREFIEGIDAKNSFAKYIDGFAENVHWRISELEKYVSDKRQMEGSSINSPLTSD